MANHVCCSIVSKLIYSHVENYTDALILLNQLTIDTKLKE